MAGGLTGSTSDGSSNTPSSVDAGDNGIVGGSLNVVIALTGELRDGSGNVESTEVVLSASSILFVDGATKGRNISSGATVVTVGGSAGESIPRVEVALVQDIQLALLEGLTEVPASITSNKFESINSLHTVDGSVNACVVRNGGWISGIIKVNDKTPHVTVSTTTIICH